MEDAQINQAREQLFDAMAKAENLSSIHKKRVEEFKNLLAKVIGLDTAKAEVMICYERYMKLKHPNSN
jgi:hypothetical protein